MSLRSGSTRSWGSCGGGATKAFPSRTISPTAAVHQELRDSRALLGTLLGRPVQVFGYPYGAYNALSRQLAAEAGYEAAVAIRRRMNGDGTDLFALRRIPVTSETSLAQFGWDLLRLSWFYGT